MKKYGLVLRTGEAEIRAVSKLSVTDKKHILPIIEFTRSRRTSKDKDGDVIRNIHKLKDIFSDTDLIVDITSEEQLINDAIKSYLIPDDGYSNWIQFLKLVKDNFNDCKISPTLIINLDDENFEENITSQIREIKTIFNSITYRCDIDIDVDDILDDISLIEDSFQEGSINFILDFNRVRVGEITAFCNKATEILSSVLERLKNHDVTFLLSGNSFPDTSEMSTIGEGKEIIKLCFIELFKNIEGEIKERYPTINLIYCDYGSINQKRNDGAVMARGWIPRVDFPIADSVVTYKRRRRDRDIKGAYSIAYSNICKTIIEDSVYIKNKITCWGVDQIESAASGAAPGANPSFWISVRMNIHINQQIKRLYEL